MRGMNQANMQNMMKKMQKLQKEMELAQNELNVTEFTAADPSNMVTATVNGAKKLVNIELDPAVVDPEDIDMLSDLLVVAVNAALDKAESTTNSVMSKYTKGIPGL